MTREAPVQLMTFGVALLADVLPFVGLEYRGQLVEFDSIALRNGNCRRGSDTTARTPRNLRYTPIESAFREPRIQFFKSALEDLLQRFTLESAGRSVAIDGFRLKKLDTFRTDRGIKLRWNLGALSSVCNLDCDFCYRYGSPTTGPAPVNVMFGKRLISMSEIETRLRHYRDRVGLFEATADLGEDFVHPRILEIYRRIRAQDPDYLIDQTTHGGFFTEEVVAELARLKPVAFCVSINSANPDIRRRVMKDKHPEVAIRSVQLLERYGIQYGGSIVGWPSIPLSDIENTIRYLDAHSPRYIRVHLPGHTRFHPSKVRYDRHETWSNLVSMLRRMQQECRSPLFWQPYLFGNDPIEPAVTGTIPGSPAAEACLLPGDVILAIDGHTIGSRQHAIQRLARASADDDRRNLRVRRDGATVDLELREETRHRESYPYGGDGYDPTPDQFGALVNQGLDPAAVVSLVRMAEETRARHVLILSSILMEGAASRCIKTVQAVSGASGTRFSIISPEARTLGGDIVMGDMLTVSDCISAVREHIADHPSVDLVTVSATMLEGGKDLVSVPFPELERQVGIRSELMSHPRILD